MKQLFILSAAAIMLLLFVQFSYAEIKVISIKGSVAYKTGAQWTPLYAGATIPVGAKISTGVKSNAVIKINDHTLTVQQLTMIKISENMLDKSSSSTKIGLRRGTVRAKVAKNSRIKTVFKVSTPVATSSVRGTEEIIFYGPSIGMKIMVIEGSIEGSSINTLASIIQGFLEFHQKGYEGNPENLLGSMIEQALPNVHPVFVTPDELNSYESFGDDFQLNDQSSISKRDININNVAVPRTSRINLILLWP